MHSLIRLLVSAIGLTGVGLTLSSCALFDKRGSAGRPSSRAAAPAARPQPAGEAPARPSGAVWDLRAGLNVAALSCRGGGRRPVASDYARLLTRHRALLAAAHRQEQGRVGVQAFDRQQTRVYNSFANQRSPARFCTAASTVAQRANGIDSAALATAAPRLLGELKASLRN